MSFHLKGTHEVVTKGGGLTECQFKNTKDKSINVKMNKGYNVVRPIMPTSPNERESFDYS